MPNGPLPRGGPHAHAPLHAPLAAGHGSLPTVKPGYSHFGHSHGSSPPPDPTEEEAARARVALDLRCKAKFMQMEPVVVELRLR